MTAKKKLLSVLFLAFVCASNIFAAGNGALSSIEKVFGTLYWFFSSTYMVVICTVGLVIIGIQMIVEGIQDRRKANEKDCSAAVPGTAESSADAACEEKADNNTVSDRRLTLSQLILQGIATSIDALSVGFTIAEYRALEAFGSSVIIAVVTFFICMGGLLFGRKFGEKLAGRATILGGLILIGIGAEIFIRGVF